MITMVIFPMGVFILYQEHLSKASLKVREQRLADWEEMDFLPNADP